MSNHPNLGDKVRFAVLAGNSLHLLQKQKEAAEKEAQEKEWKAEADTILSELPDKCKEAAIQGKRSAMVMQEKDICNFNYEVNCAVKLVRGPGLIVLDECKKNDIKVECRRQDDGNGQNSWLEIWAYW